MNIKYQRFTRIMYPKWFEYEYIQPSDVKPPDARFTNNRPINLDWNLILKRRIMKSELQSKPISFPKVKSHINISNYVSLFLFLAVRFISNSLIEIEKPPQMTCILIPGVSGHVSHFHPCTFTVCIIPFNVI